MLIIYVWAAKLKVFNNGKRIPINRKVYYFSLETLTL